MSEMAPESVPGLERKVVDVQVDYEYTNGVLTVYVINGNAKVVATLDWNGDDADPGSDFHFLHQVLPTAIARVHQEVTGA